MPNKLILTWDDVHHHCAQLSKKLMGKRAWNKVVCITRGGLVPTALISRHLDIKHVDTVCLSSYDDENDNQTELKIIKAVKSLKSDILVIDDLVDTGESLKAVRKMLPNAFYATIYAKPIGKKYVNSFIKDVSQDTWIVFPWEQ